MVGWLIGWSAGRRQGPCLLLVGCSVGWLAGCSLVVCFSAYTVSVVGFFTLFRGSLVGRRDCWLVSLSIGRSVGWLIGWWLLGSGLSRVGWFDWLGWLAGLELAGLGGGMHWAGRAGQGDWASRCCWIGWGFIRQQKLCKIQRNMQNTRKESRKQL